MRRRLALFPARVVDAPKSNKSEYLSISVNLANKIQIVGVHKDVTNAKSIQIVIPDSYQNDSGSAHGYIVER